MKKRILSLILVLMLLPIASIFSACSNSKGYNLDMLDDDFYKIVETNNNLINKNGVIEISYLAHENLGEIISKTTPYNQLSNYNALFYNLMSFPHSYIKTCSNNNLTDNAEIKNRVERDLNSFAKAMEEVNNSINIFAENVIMAENNQQTSRPCLERFENLLDAYLRMYEAATDFNSSLSDLYFNYILKDGNPDVYALQKENYASVVVNRFRARLAYQIGNLSECFIEMFVDGSLAAKVASSTGTLNLDEYEYSLNVNSLKKTFTEQIAVEKLGINSDSNSRFYELAVEAHNIQATLNNDREKFLTACKEIKFSDVFGNVSSTPLEKMCSHIILSNFELVKQYNSVLAEMLDIIKELDWGNKWQKKNT